MSKIYESIINGEKFRKEIDFEILSNGDKDVAVNLFNDLDIKSDKVNKIEFDEKDFKDYESDNVSFTINGANRSLHRDLFKGFLISLLEEGKVTL